ncbi:MAG: Gx transporter family protein [Porcipelethomonas sp.]
MSKAYKAAISGILLALSAGISAAESLIPLPLGVKPGFSNIPVMFAMSELNSGIAFSICLLKSVFVLFTRGGTAFALSLSGGMLSFAVMISLYKKTKASFLFISVCGSLAHNIGQTAAACLILGSAAIAACLPLLVISGCIAGAATGLAVSLIIPILWKLRKNR